MPPALSSLVDVALLGVGLQTDRLVAERCFEHFDRYFALSPQGQPTIRYSGTREIVPWRPSASLGDAQLVIAEMERLDRWVRLTFGRNGRWHPTVSCVIGALPTLHGDQPSHELARATAERAPLAICRAALLTVG